MDNKVRLLSITTIVREYWADPDNYGTDVPSEMARVDLENWTEYTDAMIEIVLDEFYDPNNHTTRIITKVAPVEE